MSTALPTFDAAVRHRDLLTAMGRRRLDAALATGVLCQPWRGVVIRADQSLDLRTRASAAILVAGEAAVVSGPTAVALHGYEAAESTDIHLTVPYSRSIRSRPGLVIHQSHVTGDDVVQVAGLPVLAQDLALAEYLCTGDKWHAFASLDQALIGRGKNSVAELKSEVAARLENRHDPRGIGRGLMLVELATGLAESPPESFFRLIVVEAGFPIPTPQHEVQTIDGHRLYVLDMAWESRRIALEYDGYSAHESRAQYDAERDERLAQRGWIVVRARASDLRDPTRVLAELRAAFARRT